MKKKRLKKLPKKIGERNKCFINPNSFDNWLYYPPTRGGQQDDTCYSERPVAANFLSVFIRKIVGGPIYSRKSKFIVDIVGDQSMLEKVSQAPLGQLAFLVCEAP